MRINKKAALTVTSLCLIFFALGALFVYAQTSTTFTISAGPYPGAADYTVYVEGGLYYAKSNYGAQLTSAGSTNASYVITLVYAQSPKKVVLIGPIETSGFYPSSNSVTELRGTLNLSTGANKPVINFTNIENAEFFGGVINGNWAGQTPTSATGIEIFLSSNIYIHNLNVTNCKGSGVYISNSSSVTVEGIDSSGHYFDGIAARNNVGEIIIRGNRLHDNFEGDTGNAGIWICNSPYVLCTGNIAWNNALGVRGQGYGTGSNQYKVIYDENIAYDNLFINFYVDGYAGGQTGQMVFNGQEYFGGSGSWAKLGTYIVNCSDLILNVQSSNSTTDGVTIESSDRIQLNLQIMSPEHIGLAIYDSCYITGSVSVYKAGAAYPAIKIYGNSAYNTLTTVVDGAGVTNNALTVVTPAHDNKIMGGVWVNCTYSSLTTIQTGLDNNVYWVSGYPTYAEGSYGGATPVEIFHGLPSTPTSFSVVPTTWELTWWAASVNSTCVRVDFTGQPTATFYWTASFQP